MSFTRNLTATASTHPVSFHCDEPGCEWRTAHRNEPEAVRTKVNHKCPYTLLHRKYMMDETDDKGQPYTVPTLGKSLIERYWDELDERMKKLKDITLIDDKESVASVQGEARGIALCIWINCQHWWPNFKDVIREAVKRWEIKHEGREYEPTPGYKYNPPPYGSSAYENIVRRQADQNARERAERASSKPAAKKTARGPKPLSAEHKSAIKSALDMGLPVEEMAHMFSIPIEAVRAYEAELKSNTLTNT